MASLFSSSAKKRASPAWCKKGTWIGLVPLIFGMPVKMAVFARWKQDHCLVYVDLIESFQISFNSDTKDWVGSSGNKGPNLAIEIATLDEANSYDIELMLRNNQDVIDSHTWSNQTIPAKRPLDTGRLEHVVDSEKWDYQVHAKG